MILNILIGIFIFIFGVCIGSFLNCYIYRKLPASRPEGYPGYGEAKEEKKSLKGRSFCPHCKHTLSWQDLFPIFSYLILKGKCRYCKEKISIQYPIIEIVTGILFLLIFWNFAPLFNGAPGRMTGWIFANLFFLFYVASALIIIFVYDFKHYLIPDKVLFPAIAITFIYRIFFNFSLIPNYLLAAVIASGFFLIIFLLSRGRAMGFGDVKLAILMGLLLGVDKVLAALFLAFFFGAIIGLILMAYKKKSLKSEIPFGPFLITGTFIALLYGDQIVRWYTSYLNF